MGLFFPKKSFSWEDKLCGANLWREDILHGGTNNQIVSSEGGSFINDESILQQSKHCIESENFAILT